MQAFTMRAAERRSGLLTEPKLHFNPRCGCPTFGFTSLAQPKSRDTIAGLDSDDDARGTAAAERAVLVVDDEHAIRQLIAKVLQRHDYEPFEATDGHEALEHVRRKTFHSIILDLMMPIVSGFEVLRRLAYGEQWTDAIVVRCTSSPPCSRSWARAALRMSPLRPTTITCAAHPRRQ